LQKGFIILEIIAEKPEIDNLVVQLQKIYGVKKSKTCNYYKFSNRLACNQADNKIIT
jgi:hypothetical protein